MEIDEQQAPEIYVPWYHAGPAELLSSAPVVLDPTAWQKLSREESNACEAVWKSLSPEEQATAHRYIEDELEVPPLDEDDHDFLGVPVGTDKLFEINVRTMRLYPVFWRAPGPPIKVRRCVWMYDENRAVEPALSRELEEAYHQIKPYLPSYPDEVQAALSAGTLEAQDKLKTVLQKSNHSAVFQDARSARIFQGTTPPSAGLFSWGMGRGRGGLFPGATVVWRGIEAAEEATGGKEKPTRPTIEGRRLSVSSLEESANKRQKLEVAPDASRTRRPGVHPRPSESGIPRAESPESTKSEGDQPKQVIDVDIIPQDDDTVVTDLFLIIHGIGQGYTAQYEAWDFTYATNLFRDIARKQSQSPALSSIMRNRRAQFIPIPWRASMKLEIDEERRREQEGLDNHFTLADITPKKSIPYVRELTNNVLIDIPYFMSQHRDRMIESVCLTANRAYRLWCARNPEFESHGRVHLLAHSLGSALSAHILSAQPTIQRPLSEFTQEELANMSNQFLFNTSYMFMIGSPLGIFMHINQAQLVARKGRERTMDAREDEALDRTGRFGCLAVDALYNIFNPSDPIAYLLNPCVDSEFAKTMKQSTIPSVGTTTLATLSSRITKMFDGFALPLSTSRAASPAPKSRGNQEENMEALDLGGDDRLVSQARGESRAERRFRALNPHGTIDFALPSEGTISDYVDMITAHGDYWADSSLATFVLTEIFARKEDLLRTGMALGVKG
ncbi:putative phospholipase C1020,13c OS=Schizosaccharomyces pombe (strain 972 / ATCC 24843) GN=SPCC1020.13c PE=3 SV=1 [Rhizoctonia solani AG-1 IB]|uniref:Putative phospholipase C1020,13c n=1 Tax=Thanatephorus cucumeris (strain AG1-IB / isolate 7/3/14) TaxID=1108050 RepID=A0A0B7FQT9_THACB|nr:putative phospholipase C1020,13c OS=Schizosaccharomyces pombe (strain 972 / ATCC 24843) GN=SPCC1020.13c PE=3 SV=1 [Rhizoctonia solani AG-1 IB]